MERQETKEPRTIISGNSGQFLRQQQDHKILIHYTERSDLKQSKKMTGQIYNYWPS
jgi:hypothetical protein